MLTLLLVLCGGGGEARAGEPLDIRGMWVADTGGDAHRPLRLAWPEAGQGWDAGFVADGARNLLMETGLDGEVTPVVDVMTSAHLYGGFVWRGRRLSAALPVTVYGRDLSGGFAGLGDAQVSVLQPLFGAEGRRPALGVAVSGWIPTGAEERWSGSPGLSGSAVASLGQEHALWGWAANAGVRLGRTADARNLLAGPGPVGGVEAHVRVLDDVVVGLDAVSQGAAGFSSLPVELGASLRYRHPLGGFAHLGVAMGAGDGVGASGGRLFLGVGYGGGRHVELPPPETVVVPVVVSQRRSEVLIETPVAELVDDRIVLYQQVFFREARAELIEESELVLEAVLEIVRSDDQITHLLIEGHTNSRGSRTYNQRLSEARAAEVSAWLVEAGLPEGMILARGFGEDRPLVPDEHPEAMAINRRVEFMVLRADEDSAPTHIPDAAELPASVREKPPEP